MTDLLDPESHEFRNLPISSQAREIYRLLLAQGDAPLTMRQIRERLTAIGTQEQLDRRRRELNRYFVIQKVGTGAETAYKLVSTKPRSVDADAGISERDRAAVLRYGRCAMCGRTALDDGVRLQVDHKIPKEWGGTDELENLQPLCEECNRGKKNLFSSYDAYSDEFRAAMAYSMPQQRIGEFLKAVAPDEVQSDVLELVANAGSYQEDWQKRLRELRVLGWEITTRRQRIGRRTVVFYQLLNAQPWPEGSLREELRRRERLRGY
jgi:5-methylcytosine-specific restriction endonuclease McrA